VLGYLWLLMFIIGIVGNGFSMAQAWSDPDFQKRIKEAIEKVGEESSKPSDPPAESDSR
jgi:hypothetical protein